jgi:hypothetical protein
MAVLYRPVNFRSKERYTVAPYEPSDEVSELMREMPLLYTKQSDGRTDLSAQANFGSKWGWYQSIYGLAQGDVLRFDAVTQTELFQCLNYLTFEKEKNELEAQLIKNAHNRNL